MEVAVPFGGIQQVGKVSGSVCARLYECMCAHTGSCDWEMYNMHKGKILNNIKALICLKYLHQWMGIHLALWNAVMP